MSKRRTYEMGKLLEVDTNWLTNITGEGRGRGDICWEERFNPSQDGYTTTFCYDDVVDTIKDSCVKYDKEHLELFKNEIIRVSGNIETRLILDIQ